MRTKKLQVTCFLSAECRQIYGQLYKIMYLPDLSDENVHLSFISNNSSMSLENHILLAFKRFHFENRKEKFIVNLNGFWKY